MISKGAIKEELKKYINLGIQNFVLYPFGENGLNVKNILKEYFNIEPVLIIDNGYAEFNPYIDNFEKLKKVYTNDMYIILTIENPQENNKLLEQLKEFADIFHIINLCDTLKKEADLSQFQFDSFLPGLSRDKNRKETLYSRSGIVRNKKIKVRIVNYTGPTWNSIKSICLAFKKDVCFDSLLITGEYVDNRTMDEVEKYGFKSIRWREYCVETDKPDVLILSHPHDNITYLGNCKENCKLVVVASMQLIRYCNDMDSFWRLQKKNFSRFYPDYYLFDSLLYNEISKSKYMSSKIVWMGNAKFDGIYETLRTKTYENEWEKLKGKKTVVWATDHGVTEGCIRKEVTFDLYAKAIFEYASKNSDMGLIFRPHLTFIHEMLLEGIWTKEELDDLRDYCRKSPNIIFDESVSYDKAFSIADGIITDAFCGIMCSALPTLKPICLTYRSKSDIPYHKELADCYIAAYHSQDVINFMEDISRGEDDKTLELRKEACKKYIKHFDGRNGYRIKEFIKEKFLEKGEEQI